MTMEIPIIRINASVRPAQRPLVEMGMCNMGASSAMMETQKMTTNAQIAA